MSGSVGRLGEFFMKHLWKIAGLSLIVVLASCGGGGGGNNGISLGSSGSGSQTLLTVTLTGDYFAVPATDPDFNASGTGGLTTGLVQNTLGPDGFPVVTAKASNPGTRIFDVNASNEILWWSTTEPGVTKDVSAKADPLPFSFDNFFPTGQTNDLTLMRTAHWHGTINAPNTGSLIFNGAADDDLWVFMDGVLIVDNGGVKSFQTPVDVTTAVTAGAHTLDIFYADRSQNKATLVLAIREQ
jgi:fibro-slime domain-containing protein